MDFIGIGTPPKPPGQTANDIATGWDESSEGSYDSRYDDDRYEEGYAGSYDSSASDYQGSYRDDDLDSGWEGYDEPPSAPNVQKRVYRDGLYDDESPYVDPENLDDIDAEGVYEADYRVLEPPSKSLEDLDDSRDDYPA